MVITPSEAVLLPASFAFLHEEFAGEVIEMVC